MYSGKVSSKYSGKVSNKTRGDSHERRVGENYEMTKKALTIKANPGHGISSIPPCLRW
jgi:hypothetical protein